MATGIAQKNYKASFPLWSLKKLINQKSHRRKIEIIGKNLDIEKGKNFTYSILHEF